MNGSENPLPDAAYLKALDLLSRRDHSRSELKRKLALRGFAECSLEDALERLSAQGLLDDARFAARWVESALRNGRGFGVKLLLGLQQKGIDRETARQALAASAVATPAEQVLSGIAEKRFATFNIETATQKERQRVYTYLQRRGFSLSDITSFFRHQHTE